MHHIDDNDRFVHFRSIIQGHSDSLRMNDSAVKTRALSSRSRSEKKLERPAEYESQTTYWILFDRI